jgi:hypothetical protein
LLQMKIYFTASLRGKGEFEENYMKIARCLETMGNKMVSNHVFKNDFPTVAAQDKDQAVKSYHQLIDGVKKADFFIAEVSTQSLSVGHEITQAMMLNKPVILLYSGDRKPTMLFGSDYDKLQIIQYDDASYKKLIEQALEEAKKKMDVRFNFFVSPKILNYLDWVAQKRMVPRSVFLRDLIEKEMRKDKEFRQ